MLDCQEIVKPSRLLLLCWFFFQVLCSSFLGFRDNRVTMASSPFICDDLLWEILSWAPVKSLTRFRGARKSWDFIITDPDFVKLHFDRSAKNDDLARLQIIPSAVIDDFVGMWSSVHTFLHSPDAFNINIFHPDLKFRVVGSCNGLICLVDKDVRICVSNLATRLSSRLLPRLSLGYRHWYITYGFGYVASTNAYKVVALYRQYDCKLKAKVCTLGDACWTHIQGIPESEPRISFKEQNGVYHNGRLYWIVSLWSILVNFEKDYLLFIDLATMGICSYLNLPNLKGREDSVCRQRSNHYLSGHNAILRVLKDSLCVWYPITNRAHIAIWRLEDEVSWIPMLTVNFVDLQVLPPSSWFLDALFMAQNGDIFMLSSAGDPPQWTAIQYNQSQTNPRLDVCPIPSQLGQKQLGSIIFTESLITPPF